jgi:hypothetical protein
MTTHILSMESEDEIALYDLAIERWGKPAQLLMVVEECSELIKAVCDRLRERVTVDAYLLDEMADVKIMLAQLERMVDPVELERIRQAKLQRLRARLDSGHKVVK